MPSYTIFENIQNAGPRLEFGINDGFYMTKFGWDEENNRFEAEFSTDKTKYPVRVILSEPSASYTADVDKAAQKISMVLTHIVSRFVPIEKLKDAIGDVPTLKAYVEKLQKLLPRDFSKKELEVVLRWNNNGYLALPRSLGGLPHGFMRVKSSDQEELIVSDWFIQTFGTKPEVPSAPTTDANEGDDGWQELPF